MDIFREGNHLPQLERLFGCGELRAKITGGFTDGEKDVYWDGDRGMMICRWPEWGRINVREVLLNCPISEAGGDIEEHILTDLSYSRLQADDSLCMYQCVCRTETVEIPGSLSLPGQWIGTEEIPVGAVTGGAFQDNKSLRQIILGEGIEEIEYYIRDCPNLETVLLPDSFYRYEALGVSGCPAFRGFRVKKTNPSVLEEDGCLILWKNARLESRLLGEIRQFSGCRLVCGCYGRKECAVSDGVEIICPGAFCERAGLEKVIVPDSVTVIGDEAFAGCGDLREVYLPRKLTTIGERAFYGCESLRTLEMPEELARIGMGAFWNCGALEEPDVSDETELFSNDYSAKLLFGPDPELNRW